MKTAPSKNSIEFLLNEETVRLDSLDPSTTVLDYLRLSKKLCGTKEGCNEGDCGACTVLIGRLRGEKQSLHYISANACIVFLAALDGCHLVTIEHLYGTHGAGGAATRGLHKVQEAFVNHHASQCGFCTPGFVMSTYALWMETPKPSAAQVDKALQGNLCRCTGYVPIRNAAMAGGYKAKDDPLFQEREVVREALLQMSKRFAASGGKVVKGGEDSKALTILPSDIKGLASALKKYPKATIVAGATDVGLWVTKMGRAISPAIFIAQIEDLQKITADKNGITFGAGCSYTDAAAPLIRAYPHLAELWHRIGGVQVRNNGTLGGNIANGSPIGDCAPAFIALGARLGLRYGEVSRARDLEGFFLDYGRQDLQAGEFIESIFIPAPNLPKGSVAHNAAYKISKRRDEDISTLSIAFNIVVSGGRISAARIALGGMAGIPKRASSAEAALVGQGFNLESFKVASQTLGKDFQPLSDMRGSDEYRLAVAQNMFERFYLEATEDSGAVRLSVEGLVHG